MHCHLLRVRIDSPETGEVLLSALYAISPSCLTISICQRSPQALPRHVFLTMLSRLPRAVEPMPFHRRQNVAIVLVQ